MDLKKEAARAASLLVKNNTSIGLGDGSTIKYLAEFIINDLKNPGKKIYTSSALTKIFLQDAGIVVNDISTTDNLDIYFDGCDQVDYNLNAIKSGSGIHTQEKLFATMANRFVILADTSKFVAVPDKKFPLVIEVLPQAIMFVQKEIKNRIPETIFNVRMQAGENIFVKTQNGNLLIDCFFNEWPDLEFINNECKKITGLVEISLFYKIATDAIIAGINGIKFYERKNDKVSLIN
jgi:ribose 5-phosphate isomerase A